MTKEQIKQAIAQAKIDAETAFQARIGLYAEHAKAVIKEQTQLDYLTVLKALEAN